MRRGSLYPNFLMLLEPYPVKSILSESVDKVQAVPLIVLLNSDSIGLPQPDEFPV
jgi:hypothetical protein